MKTVKITTGFSDGNYYWVEVKEEDIDKVANKFKEVPIETIKRWEEYEKIIAIYQKELHAIDDEIFYPEETK